MNICYYNGKYLNKDEISISPDDRGFLFADGLYEVIKSYNGRMFQAKMHIERLNYGAREIQLSINDFDYLIDISKELIKKNNLEAKDSAIYFQVTRGIAPRLHSFPDILTPLTVYGYAKELTSNKLQLKDGINIIKVPDIRWARCDIKTVGLIANVLANQKAHSNNAAEAIFVKDGMALEGTSTNLIGIYDGCVVTAPKNNYILGGITREVVLNLCRKLNITVLEKPIPSDKLEMADELMIVGTTTEITPIVKIHGKSLGSGKPGPITKKLQKEFFLLT